MFRARRHKSLLLKVHALAAADPCEVAAPTATRHGRSVPSEIFPTRTRAEKRVACLKAPRALGDPSSTCYLCPVTAG